MESSKNGIFLSYSFDSRCSNFVRYIYEQLNAVHITTHYHYNIEYTASKEYRQKLVNEIKCSELFISFIDYNLHKITDLSKIGYELPMGTHLGEIQTAKELFKDERNICVCLIGNVPKSTENLLNIDGFKNRILYLKSADDTICSTKALFTFLNKLYDMELQVTPFLEKPTDPWKKEYTLLHIANICHLPDNDFITLKENIRSSLNHVNKHLSFITYCGNCDTCTKEKDQRYLDSCHEYITNRLLDLQKSSNSMVLNNDNLIFSQGSCDRKIGKNNLKMDIWLSRYPDSMKQDYKILEYRGITFISLKDSFRWTKDCFDSLFTSFDSDDKVSSNIKILVCYRAKAIQKHSYKQTMNYFRLKGLDLILCNDQMGFDGNHKAIKNKNFVKNTCIISSRSNDNSKDKFSYNLITIKQDFTEDANQLEKIIKIKINGVFGTNNTFNKYDTPLNFEGDSFSSYLSSEWINNRIDNDILDSYKKYLIECIDTVVSKRIILINRTIPEIEYAPSEVLKKSNLNKVICTIDFKNKFKIFYLSNIYQFFWKVIYHEMASRYPNINWQKLFPYKEVNNSLELQDEFENLKTLLRLNNSAAENGIWFVFDNWEGFNGTNPLFENDDQTRESLIKALKDCVSSKDRIVLIVNKFAMDNFYTGVGEWEKTMGIFIPGDFPHKTYTSAQINELVNRCHIRDTYKFRNFIINTTNYNISGTQEILLKLRGLKIYHRNNMVDQKDLAVHFLPSKDHLIDKSLNGSLIINDLKRYVGKYKKGGLSKLLKQLSKITQGEWTEILDSKKSFIKKSKVERLIGKENIKNDAWIYFNNLIELGFIEDLGTTYIIQTPIAFINL